MLVAVALANIPGRVSAAVTLAASRGELLYSQNADLDCSKLHAMTDAELPFNVARLSVGGVTPGTPVSYRWSIAKKIDGVLAADLDLGPGEETSAVSGMCAEFGNACVLTR